MPDFGDDMGDAAIRLGKETFDALTRAAQDQFRQHQWQRQRDAEAKGLSDLQVTEEVIRREGGLEGEVPLPPPGAPPVPPGKEGSVIHLDSMEEAQDIEAVLKAKGFDVGTAMVDGRPSILFWTANEAAVINTIQEMRWEATERAREAERDARAYEEEQGFTDAAKERKEAENGIDADGGEAVAPPAADEERFDENGYARLGPECDDARAAVRAADAQRAGQVHTKEIKPPSLDK
jgi:hypothetical protein